MQFKSSGFEIRREIATKNCCEIVTKKMCYRAFKAVGLGVKNSNSEFSNLDFLEKHYVWLSDHGSADKSDIPRFFIVVIQPMIVWSENNFGHRF